MRKSVGFKVMLLLAFLQGVAGLLRAFNWVEIGFNLSGQGILLLPFIGAVAVMRGLFISVVALLYVLFIIGALLERSWGWWSCLGAVVINLMIVLSGLGVCAAETTV